MITTAAASTVDINLQTQYQNMHKNSSNRSCCIISCSTQHSAEAAYLTRYQQNKENPEH